MPNRAISPIEASKATDLELR